MTIEAKVRQIALAALRRGYTIIRDRKASHAEVSRMIVAEFICWWRDDRVDLNYHPEDLRVDEERRDTATPAEHDLLMKALRRALADAVDELDEHDREYKYYTSKCKKERWRALASGDAAAETLARLDEAGLDSRSGPTQAFEDALRAQYATDELRPPPLRDVVKVFDTARRYFIHDLPRWDDDGGAPVGELCQ